MDYIKDPTMVSVLWGRIGAAILALVAFALGIFGYTLTPEDQTSLATLIGSILTGLAGVLAIVSKVREKKKVE